MFPQTVSHHVRFSRGRLFATMLVGLSIAFIRVDANGTTKDQGPGSVDNWPSGLSPETADMFCHNEVMVHASASTVWRYLVAAEQWPTWYNEVQNIRILNSNHVLGRGSKIAWNTLGLFVESTVAECIPNERLTWLSNTNPAGAVAYHVWVLIPIADGCKVVTEKTEAIQASAHFTATDAYATEHRVLQIWLNRLKALSESAKQR